MEEKHFLKTSPPGIRIPPNIAEDIFRETPENLFVSDDDGDHTELLLIAIDSFVAYCSYIEDALSFCSLSHKIQDKVC